MQFLLLLVLLLHYGEGKRCSNFRRWCGRYDAVFTAVGAAITLRRGNAAQIFAVGVGVTMPFLLLLVLLLHYGEEMLLKFSPLVWALRCRFYCCWCCYYTTARANAA